MDNEDLREQQEEESLIKKAAKKAISKTIKEIPLSVKLWIIGIILGIVFFLILFITIMATMMPLLFFDDNNDVYTSELEYIGVNDEDNFWWPIGGTEVQTHDGKEFATGQPATTNITSHFGHRTILGIKSYHNGIDISGGGNPYIIATTSGIVSAINDSCDNNGYYLNKCGGGFGNYVIISHANGIYSISAHLYPGSITVTRGDKVEQGQIIGKMGNSGSSTGTHLHFQIEEGARSSANAVDPLNYISPNNPRPVTINSGITEESNMLSMLRSWEGTGNFDNDNYYVYDDGGGVLTVGHGVTLKYNAERFKKRNIDVNELNIGSKVNIELVDEIELEILNEKRNSVINLLEKNNIDLEEYQIEALIMRVYNVGNINQFPSNYEKYGNTIELYDNYMSKPVNNAEGEYQIGLSRRREAEWLLFNKGIYTIN